MVACPSFRLSPIQLQKAWLDNRRMSSSVTALPLLMYLEPVYVEASQVMRQVGGRRHPSQQELATDTHPNPCDWPVSGTREILLLLVGYWYYLPEGGKPYVGQCIGSLSGTISALSRP